MDRLVCILQTPVADYTVNDNDITWLYMGLMKATSMLVLALAVSVVV